MATGISTVGGILLLVLGFMMRGSAIVISGSLLISAALIAGALREGRDWNKNQGGTEYMESSRATKPKFE
jgi:hypothetical protein